MLEYLELLAREAAAVEFEGPLVAARNAGLPPDRLAELEQDWKALLFPDADDERFADGYAQAVTFGLLMAKSRKLDLSKGLHEVARALEAVLGEAEAVKLAWRPNLKAEVGEDEARTLLKLIDTLDDDDDVQTVWGNYEISDEVMEKLG